MTTREWFRTARHHYRPVDDDEQQAVFALRSGHWVEAEFWTLMWGTRLSRPKGEHHWYLDDYRWHCHGCAANVPSDRIGEVAPDPSHFSTDCNCLACLPCTGVDL